ncbi:hypothetical protein ACFQUU_27240 [Herbaspirillum sp. GCM10030257]|uniref:hypothetical protein n=1 Tax=Herbaspirillum sp. GCM10030257 TaxID=3273393 RepID=UPI00360DA67A
MIDRVEITEAMVAAAMAAGKAAGVLASHAKHADVRRVVSAAKAEFSELVCGPRFDLLVNTTVTTKKARFLGATDQRCYYRVECEDGQILTVHGNDIRTAGRTR